MEELEPVAPATAPIGEGWRLQVDPALGRVVVATRSFAIGELVMSDQPLVVFDSGDDAAFLKAFAAAPESKRAAILDMVHPPLDKDANALVVAHRAAAAKFDGRHGLSKELIHKLLLIRDTNTHSYSGHEIAFDAADDGTDKGALFENGSKLAHSCLPNCAYSSSNLHGGLEYRACRPIAAGDMMTFSYLGDIWTKNTPERRAECLETKDFVCCCPRCNAPDATNGVLCPNRACTGFAVPMASDYSSDPEVAQGARCYVCDACGPLSTEVCAEFYQRERQLMAQLVKLKRAAYEGDVAAPDRVRKVADIAKQALSPTHWIVPLAYDTLAMFCVHHATHVQRAKGRGMVKEPFGSAASLHEAAASAHSSFIGVCECMAVGCRGGAGCTQPHPALHEMVKAAFDTAQELRQLKLRARPKEICDQLAKYLPHMEMIYRAADVKDVNAMLEETRARTAGKCADCPAEESARSEAEVATDWLSGLGLTTESAVATPRSRTSGGGKKKGKGKR